MSTITGWKSTTVHTRDIAKARTFYAKTLGLREVSFDTSLGTAQFELPGTKVLLGIHQWGPMCNEHSGGRAPGTVTGNVLLVANVEKAAADLKQQGVTITDQPMKTPWGPMATIADVDGNEFIIMQA